MIKTGFIKKSLSLATIAMLSLFIGSVFLSTYAGVINQRYIHDSFDDGLNENYWQIVDDPSESIGFAGFAGTLRYVDPTGAEEAMVTTQPLTTGTDVIGYSVEFDFHYLSDDWGDWFAFAFNKTSVDKGLNWGKGGYLMGRITSLQVNNPNDSVDGPSSPAPGVITSFQEMTPTLANIANQNVRIKFVYTNANQELKLYYDLVSDDMDLTTLRNTFTFGSLTSAEDYHFAIISSGKGLYELDNLVINKLTTTDPILYVDEDFESNELPEEITVLNANKFSYGPAMALEFNDTDPNARFVTLSKVVLDTQVAKPLSIRYEQSIESLTLDHKFSFLFGMDAPNSPRTSEGMVDLYFVNRDVSGTVKTFIGATKGNGTDAVQVLTEQELPINLAGVGYLNVQLELRPFNNVFVNVHNTVNYTFKGTSEVSYMGFNSQSGNHVLIDNFDARISTFHDQSDAPDLHENFNTGYIDSNLWQIYNYRDLRPGTDLPLFPSAKGIYVDNGKLVFDVAGESARLITRHQYSNVEVRFSLEDFNKPVTPMNEDGEIDGIEVPPTFYVALSFGYESTAQNFWNVPSIIFQARDGGAVIYTLNMNDNTVYAIEQDLLMSAVANDDETFEFKVVAVNGQVDVWMKRVSDPITIFDGAPTVTYYNVNTVGKVAIASSAAGSFKIDDVSIVKTGETFDRPIIEDSIDPATLIAPVITRVSNKTHLFEQNSDTTVDFKTYFTVTDNGTPVTITNEMLNLGGFSLTQVGHYAISLTVTDVDGNVATDTIYVSVYPEVIEPIIEDPIDDTPANNESNVVLVSVLTGVGSLSIGAAGVFLVLKKIKKF